MLLGKYGVVNFIKEIKEVLRGEWMADDYSKHTKTFIIQNNDFKIYLDVIGEYSPKGPTLRITPVLKKCSVELDSIFCYLKLQEQPKALNELVDLVNKYKGYENGEETIFYDFENDTGTLYTNSIKVNGEDKYFMGISNIDGLIKSKEIPHSLYSELVTFHMEQEK